MSTQPTLRDMNYSVSLQRLSHGCVLFFPQPYDETRFERRNRITNNKIFLSQIFNWYRRDFGGKNKVFHFLLEYLEKDEKTDFLKGNIDTVKVDYLFYDWNLNH